MRTAAVEFSELAEAIRQEGWRTGFRWWLWARTKHVRCPYCVGLDQGGWEATCDCFKAERKP